ncbi:hypothetical protein Pint_33833 [Pistacia integerrima]|uniref:Uncharacterized protein n=1 Tax=Pistacia integerrima TaxID=434235 RepID=A0ACC0X6T1_9ROSI|nr:hypothetical protein Pint_33833 [Pistacia integerrima]
MAFATFPFPNITPLVSVKLDGSNYLNWTTQLTPLLRSHDLLGIVDGSEPCPPKFATDSEGKTTSNITTDYMVWTTLANSAKNWSDQLAAVGKPVDDEDLISYVVGVRHPPTQLATMATHTHVTQEEDQPWFLDNGANTHVTSTLNNLTLTQQPYQGPTQVTVGNGGGLLINHTSSSILKTNNSSLLLSNVLHCPRASSNLVSIQQLCQDNNCYFILTATSFVEKELQTNKILFQGPNREGLYPIYFQPFNSNKRQHNLASNSSFTAFLGVITPATTWHA